MQKEISVSILLPVYNGEKYLAEAIASLLAQTYSSFEILVLDDGSTDRSQEVARSFPDERIRIVPNGCNMGVAKTLNKGISVSRGRYIARMDSDDKAFPERLQRQVSFLEENPGVSMVGSNALSLETGKPTFPVPLTHEEIHANLLFNCSFLHPTVVWRKDDFIEENLWYDENPTAEDYELWERAALVLRMANLRQPLLHYRNDPEVKLTRYVRQQKEGGRRVRERALRRLGMDPSPWELEIHHACSYDNLPQPPVRMEDIDHWLSSILEANQKVKMLDPVILRDRLHRQRYYHFRRNCPPFSVRDFFRARGELGHIPLAYGMRMLGRFLRRASQAE